MTKGFKGVVAAAATLTLILSGTLSGSAAGAPAMRPTLTQPHGYWDLSGVPGQVIQGSLTLTNETPAPASYSIYSADGVTSEQSGIVYNNEATGDGAWVHLSETHLTLASKAAQAVPFTVTVPAGARPGDHVGAIAAANLEPAVSGGQFSMSVTDRTVIAIVIHVPGQVDRSSATVGGPSVTVENAKRQILNLPLAWSADTLGKPSLAFQVTRQGKILLHFDQHLDTFTAHAAITFPVPLDNQVFQPGEFCMSGTFALIPFTRCFTVTPAQANVPAPGSRGPRAAAPAPGLPPILLAGILAVVGLSVLLRITRRRRLL